MSRFMVAMPPLLLVLLAVWSVLALSLLPQSSFAQTTQDWRVNYTISVTPLTTLTPPPFPTSATVLTAEGGDDLVTANVSIGFPFTFYGKTYETCALSSNGNIQFETTYAYYPGAFPVGPQGGTPSQPILAYFWVDLNPLSPWGSGNGDITYTTLGSTPGSRTFVVRLTNVWYWNAEVGVTIDVTLFETSNIIQVSYYSLGQWVRTLTVGASSKPHSDFTVEYTVWNGTNAVDSSPARLALLNQTMLTFTPSAPVPYVSTIPPPTPTARGTYNVSILPIATPLPPLNRSAAILLDGSDDAVYAIDLDFPFWFYGTNFSTVYLSTNGVLQFVSTSTTPFSFPIPTSDPSLVPFVAFALNNWSPWSYGALSYEISGAPNDRILRIHFEDVRDYETYTGSLTCDVLLYQRTAAIEVYYTSLPTLRQSVLIGMQSSAQYAPGQWDYAVVVNNQLLSRVITDVLNNALVRFTVVNASIATNALPRIGSSLNYTVVQSVPLRQPMPATAYPLEGSNDNTDYIPFGFVIRFGVGHVYSGAYLTTNGELQFGAPQPLYQPFTLPLNRARAPVLAFFYTDMFPLVSGERSYATTGLAPNRTFTLRLDNVPYTSQADSVVAPTVSLDVVIFEDGSRIEVRYYRVPAVAQPVVVGAQTSPFVRLDGLFDFVSVINGRSLVDVAASLNSTTWVLMPTNTTRIPTIIPSYTHSRGAALSSTPRISLPNMTTNVVPIMSSTVFTVPIGFNFTFYGVSYSSINVSPLGYMMFTSMYEWLGYPYAWPNGASPYAPLIALWDTSMEVYGYYEGLLATPVVWYATIGQAPSRQFVIQYWNFTVYSNLQKLIHVDLILNETSNAIEMRHYAVTPAPYNPVAVGIFGSSTARADGTYDFDVVLNAEMVDSDRAIDITSRSYVFTINTDAITTVPLPETYNVSATPLPSLVPPTLYSAVNLPALDNGRVQVPLGFLFSFYGRRYGSIFVGSEGAFVFSRWASPSVSQQLPTTDSSVVPLFAFFATDLVVSTSASNAWSYATSGVFPNRVFTLRLSNVSYASAAANGTNAGVTLDVQLFEFDSHISVSYYRVNVSYAQSVLVGLQSPVGQRYDHTYDYTAWVNFAPLYPSVVRSLQGMQVSFWSIAAAPAPQPTLPFTPSYTGTYNATHTFGVVPAETLSSPTYMPSSDDGATLVPLGFFFYFFGFSYDSVYLSSNGNVQFAQRDDQRDYRPDVIPGGNYNIAPLLAFFYLDLYVETGRYMYQTLGAAPQRRFIARMDNVEALGSGDTTSVDLVLFEADNSIEIRFYNVGVSGSANVLIGLENTKPVVGALPDYAVVVNAVPLDDLGAMRLASSTVRFQVVPSSRVRLPGSYNITSTPGAVAFTMPANAQYIEGSNDNMDQVALGFPFVFYGETYTTLQVSSNGDIQFATSYASYTPRRMPYASPRTSPYLAYFYTDLYPMSSTAKQYASIGAYPNRIFVLRLSNVPYATTHDSSSAPAVSIDVLFYEAGYQIEVRYIRVDPSAQVVNIGCEGQLVMRADGSVDYTTYLNQVVLTSAIATTLLQNTTLRFFSAIPIAPLPLLPDVTYNYTSNAVPALVTLTDPTAVPFDWDDQVNTVPIGFTFNFYHQNYTEVAISANGNLQFATTSSAYYPFVMPTTDSDMLPLLAFAFVDLSPQNGGSVSYATQGTTPNMWFIVRFTNVPYIGSEQADGDVSVDVLLYETSGDIRLRYYKLSSSDASVLIGVQGSNSPAPSGVYDALPINNAVPIVGSDSSNGFVGREFVIFKSTSAGVQVPVRVPLSYNSTTTYAGLVAPTLTSPTSYPWPSSSSSSSPTAIWLRAPFPVWFYGKRYTLLRVMQSGAISFATGDLPAISSVMPLRVSTSLPLLAVALTLLTPTPTSSLLTQTTGTFPSREFLVRFDGLMYSSAPSSGITADVVFVEDTGVVSFTYWRFDTTNQTVLIGIQGDARLRSDYTYDFLAQLNGGTVNAVLRSSLYQRRITFQPKVYVSEPQQLSTPVATWMGSYNLSFTQTAAPRLALSNPLTFWGADDDVVYVWFEGMSFRFYGVDYTYAWLSTNGNIQFDTSDASRWPDTFPASGWTYPMIAFMWTDLDTRNAVVQGQLLGAAPLRYYVMRHIGVQEYNAPENTLDCDVLLYETSGVIEVRYYTVGPIARWVQIGVQGTSLDEFGSVWNNDYFGDVGSFAMTFSTVLIKPVTQYQSPFGYWYNTTVQRNALLVTTPPALMNAVPIAGSNDNVDTIPIGFAFRFYSSFYTHVNLGSNGDLQFATAYPSYVRRFIPSQDPTVVPYVAFFNTDLYPMASTAKMYALSGTAPNRALTIRYNAVPYTSTQDQSASPGASPCVTIDVLLYEYTANIEVRYYRVDASNQTVLIGVEGNLPARPDQSIDSNVLYQQVAMTSAAASLLQGSIITFANLNVTGPPPAPAPNMYNVTTIRSVAAKVDMSSGATPLALMFTQVEPNVPLGFTFTFYGVNYTTVNVAMSGNLQFASQSQSSHPFPFDQGSGGLAPFIAFAYCAYYVNSNSWVGYKTFGVAPYRSWVLRFDYVMLIATLEALSVDVVLFETTNVIESRFYTCGPSGQYNPMSIGIAGSSVARFDGTYDAVYAWDAAEILPGSVSDFINVTYRFTPDPLNTPRAPLPLTYKVTVNSSVAVRQPLPSTAYVMPVSNDYVDYAPLGFGFKFFGSVYSVVRVNTNGALEFTSTSARYSVSPMPTGNGALLPVFAFFYTDLYPTVSGMISFATSGAAPSRVFTLRYDQVPYYATSDQPWLTMSADVLLYEQDSHIEVRFYRVDPCPSQYVLIGVQRDNARRPDLTIDYTAYVNSGPLTPTLTNQLSNTTVTFSLVTPVSAVTVPTLPVLYGNASASNYAATLVRSSTGRVRLSNPQSITFGAGAIVTVPIGFSFRFFNGTYTSVGVSASGNLQFASSSDSSEAGSLPLPASAGMAPMIAYFWTVLYLQTDSYMAYQTLGVGPARSFVLRLENVALWTSVETLTMDVVLFEQGSFELRFYDLPSVEFVLTPVTIGVQGPTSASSAPSSVDWIAVVNAGYVYSDSTVLALDGSVLQFVPRVLPAASSSSGGGVVGAVSSSAAVRASSSAAPVSMSSSGGAVVVPSSGGTVVVSSSAAVRASSSAAAQLASSVPVPPLASSAAPLASSVPVPPLASSAAPLASSVPVPPLASSAPLVSSAPRASSAPLASSAAPPATASTGAPGVDPLGCTPVSLTSGASVARVRLLLAVSLATLRSRSDAASFFPQLLYRIVSTLSVPVSALSCGSYSASSSTLAVNGLVRLQLLALADGVTVDLIVQSSGGSTAETLATLIANAIVDDGSPFYMAPATGTLVLSDVMHAGDQLPANQAVTTGCVPSDSGTFTSDCPGASSSSSGLSGGAIAGVVVGVIVGLVLCVALAILVRSRFAAKARSVTGGDSAKPSVFAAANTGHAALEESHTQANDMAVEIEMTEEHKSDAEHADLVGEAEEETHVTV